MKKIAIAISILAIIPSLLWAQLKSQDAPAQIKQEIMKPYSDQFIGFGLLDPARFSMSHSLSMSYFSIGGRGVSQNVYLNTMTYQIASPLLLKVQWGIQNFPYNSLAKDHPAFQNGFFVSGAELSYKPSDKFEVRLEYNSLPAYSTGMYRYHSPFRPYQNFWWDDGK
ncbi:MAG: hypothetical protein ONB27_04730 [candidate division KSB1 bacterium]|nr:hypothetical protein [candidate division KSB1 bacterium]